MERWLTVMVGDNDRGRREVAVEGCKMMEVAKKIDNQTEMEFSA